MESKYEHGIMWQQISEIVSHADCHDMVVQVERLREINDKLMDKCLEAAEQGEYLASGWLFLAEVALELYKGRLDLPTPSAGDVDAWRVYGSKLVGWLWVIDRLRSDWVNEVLDKI